MSKVKKRVRPTKEQWHELNRLLDKGAADDGRWDKRKLETKHRHEKDAINIIKLAYQGCSREEIANKIKRSKDYVSKLAVEFDIEIQRK